MLAAGQIVHAFATRLTGLPLAASVFTDRAWPLAKEQLPAWKVLPHDEDVELGTIHKPAIEAHALQLELHGFVYAVSEIDDALAALSAEALTAIFSQTPPADALSDIRKKVQITLTRIERTMTKEGEASMGLVLITLRVEFKTRADQPETIL
jgi:hypothetical protein